MPKAAGSCGACPSGIWRGSGRIPPPSSAASRAALSALGSIRLGSFGSGLLEVFLDEQSHQAVPERKVKLWVFFSATEQTTYGKKKNKKKNK